MTASKKTKAKEKVYAFIDSQNVNLAIKEQGWELDFKRFHTYLQDKYHVRKAFLFLGYIKTNAQLYSYLKKAGYILIFKPTLTVMKDKIKGNCDAELVLHSMIEYLNYDKAVVVSGDGDFHCLIEYLIKQKKFSRLLVPHRKKYSRLLWNFNDTIDFMDSLEKKLAKKNRGRRS